MKTYLIIFTIALLGKSISAQPGIVQTIKGKVINKATNETVAYTNIGIEDTFYGTASDEEGNFQLKVPGEMASGELYFSAIGYKNLKIPVASLFDREFNIIKLEPQSYDIGDVDVEARSKVLIRILRMAAENTPYNYLGGPFNLACRLEHERTTDDTLVVREEADVLFYDKTGYRQPSKTNAFTMRNYEITKDEPDYSFSTAMTNFDELPELDWVRSATSIMNPALLPRFNLELKDEPETGGQSFWVIAFSMTDPSPEGTQDFYATMFRGEITIDKDDYSIRKIKGTAQSPRHNRQGKSLAVGPSSSAFFQDVSYDFEVTYSGMKPDQFRLNKTYRFNGQKVEEKTSLTVLRVKTTDLKEIASRDYFVE